MSGFVTAEGVVVPTGTDVYDYVNDQRRQVASIRSIVPVTDSTALSAVSAGMTADGRATSETNPLIAYKLDSRSLAIKGSYGEIPLMSALVTGHMGRTAGFQTWASGLNPIIMDSSQWLIGGVTFDNANDSLVVPLSGYYRVNAQFYWSGTVTAVNIGVVAQTGSVSRQVSNVRMLPTGSDTCGHASILVYATAGDKFQLQTQTGAQQAWGSTGLDGCFLEVQYVGWA